MQLSFAPSIATLVPWAYSIPLLFGAIATTFGLVPATWLVLTVIVILTVAVQAIAIQWQNAQTLSQYLEMTTTLRKLGVNVDDQKHLPALQRSLVKAIADWRQRTLQVTATAHQTTDYQR